MGQLRISTATWVVLSVQQVWERPYDNRKTIRVQTAFLIFCVLHCSVSGCRDRQIVRMAKASVCPVVCSKPAAAHHSSTNMQNERYTWHNTLLCCKCCGCTASPRTVACFNCQFYTLQLPTSHYSKPVNRDTTVLCITVLTPSMLLLLKHRSVFSLQNIDLRSDVVYFLCLRLNHVNEMVSFCSLAFLCCHRIRVQLLACSSNAIL